MSAFQPNAFQSNAFQILAGGSFTVWTISPSGGITFGGVTTTVHLRLLAPSGALTFTGSPLFIKTNVYDVTGGVTFGGSNSLIFLPFGTPGQPKLPLVGAGIT
jgi:hypothetical protein